MTEPTNKELDAVIKHYRTRIYPQDMQPHFERAIMRAALAKWGAQPAPKQDVLAAGGDSFLLLPTRPTPDAPANTAGLSWDAYSGAQMLAYGRLCSDAALLVAREGGVA